VAATLYDYVLDSGLDALQAEATDIVLLSAEPTSYAEANATYALGRKVFGAGSCFTAAEARTPNGRKVASAAITDGAISADGTAAYWAVIDTVNSRLLAHGSLASGVAVTNGNSFSLDSFDIGIPGQ
jgi:hypothetical protein